MDKDVFGCKCEFIKGMSCFVWIADLDEFGIDDKQFVVRHIF